MNNNNDFLVNDFSKFKNYAVICEDFYNNPFSVFKSSIETGYIDDWPYGARTVSMTDSQYIIDNIGKHLPRSAGTSCSFRSVGGCSGSFIRQPKNQYGSWNHVDTSQTDSTMWAAVVYMHPFPILEAGTNLNSYKNTLYKHIDSYTDEEKDLHAKDNNRWFNNIYSSNVFNKIIIYSGNTFHAAADKFGDTLFNCRNANTFFWTTI